MNHPNDPKRPVYCKECDDFFPKGHFAKAHPPTAHVLWRRSKGLSDTGEVLPVKEMEV